jgi:hypothetical protein
LQWNSQVIDVHENECVQLGALKMHDAQ